MKNLYKSLKLKYLTAVPLLFVLLISTNVQGQAPLTGSVDVTFTDLNDGGDAGSDFVYFNLGVPTPNCGVVANVKVEIIDDQTTNGTSIFRLRAPSFAYDYSPPVGAQEFTIPVNDSISYYYDNWTLWATEDGVGGPSSATFRVTYEYKLPYVTCKDFTIDLDTDDGTLNATDITNVTNVCGTSTASLSKDMFTYLDKGDNTVTLTVTDENLVQATCEATVTVIGVTECKDTTLQLDAAGVASLAAADLYIGEDADISPVSISQTDFACSDVGDVAVTLTMEDGSGTETTCISTVTVADTLKPMAMCMDTIVQLDESGNFALTAEHVEDGSTDNCGIATSTVAPNTFNTADLGENTVTLTVTDNSGNVGTCEAVVTIKTDKDAVCKDTTLYIDNSGAATLAGAEADLLVSTNVENYTLALETADFSCADIGEYRNALYVTNAANDSAICYSTVTVMDTTPPMVTCTDLTLTLDENGDASIVETDIVTASSDNCGIEETLLSQTAFNCNATGANLVTITVTDNNGNQTTCSSTVTVNDDTAPTALCKDITIQLDENDSYSLEASEIDNGSSDNCGMVMSVDMASFNCSDIGANVVTLTVTDPSGNKSTCTSTVTVEDVAPQVLECKETTIYLRDNGVYVLSKEEMRRIAVGQNNINSCASSEFITTTISQRLFDCEDAGTSVPVTITVTDALSQVSTCNTVINVRDTVKPVVSCVENMDVYLDETGSASIAAMDLMMSDEADACEPYTTSLSQANFTCEDAGENMVTLTVQDPSNNKRSCSTMVMVYDTIAPVVDTIDNIEIELEAGVCESTIEYPTPNVMDNCSVELELVEGLGVDGMFQAGTTTETWTATDAGGNSVTFSFDVTIVTVNDTPMVNAIDDVIVFEGTTPVNVELTGISSGNDCVDQEVMISAEASDTDLVTDIAVNFIQGSATGSLDLTIAPGMTGSSEITVMVEDADSVMVTETFMVTVNENVNEAPMVVMPIADQEVNASYVLKIPVSPVLGEYFDDPDGDVLTYEVMLENGDALPAWATYENDTIYAEPMIADTGCVMVVVKAMDAELSATDTFEVCVEGYPVGTDDFANQFSLDIYPNPTRGNVNIELNASRVYDVVLSVHDITGRQIMSKKYDASERISFNLNENVSGMYFVKLNFDGRQIVKKLILDRN